MDYATNNFRSLNLVNVTKRRDVVKLILLLSCITLWCLFDDITDILQAKAQCLYILRFCSLDSQKTWQYSRSFVTVSVSCLCVQCQSASLGRVTRVRYDSSSAAYNLLILIIISQVWSQINIPVSECDNRGIIRCPVYTAPYVRLSPAVIGSSSSILAYDWSIAPVSIIVKLAVSCHRKYPILTSQTITALEKSITTKKRYIRSGKS